MGSPDALAQEWRATATNHVWCMHAAARAAAAGQLLAPLLACTKLAWEASCGSNTSALGKRLGADQKGAPVLVTASSGKV